MRYSEYDAHLALSKRAELARQTAYYEEEDPIGCFRGMYWGIWLTLVVGAAITSLVGCMP